MTSEQIIARRTNYNTPENKEDFVLIRLDKRYCQMILATLESKTVIEIERLEEK